MKLFYEKVWGDNMPTKHVVWMDAESQSELMALLHNQDVVNLKLERRGPQFVIEIIEP